MLNNNRIHLKFLNAIFTSVETSGLVLSENSAISVSAFYYTCFFFSSFPLTD